MNALSTTSGHEIMERVITVGDLAQLTPEERNTYYNEVCRSVGLNPLTRPFEYLRLQNKLVLYARRDAADQLRKINGISLRITDQKAQDGLFLVTVEAQDKSGRVDSDMGAVAFQGLQGEAKANAILKAITKAKRRVTLSISGLGMLDETEVSDIPERQPWSESERPPARDVTPPTKTLPPPPEPQRFAIVNAFGVVAWEGTDWREALAFYGRVKAKSEDPAAVARHSLPTLKAILPLTRNGNRAKLEAEIAAAEATAAAEDEPETTLMEEEVSP